MQITTVGNMVITIGWLIALLVLVLAIVFLIIGVPDPRTLLVERGAGCVERPAIRVLAAQAIDQLAMINLAGVIRVTFVQVSTARVGRVSVGRDHRRVW